MNKGRRNELRDLKWKRRLKNLGLKRVNNRDFICYRDQGKPCSCPICSPKKWEGEKTRYRVRSDEEVKNARNDAYGYLITSKD